MISVLNRIMIWLPLLITIDFGLDDATLDKYPALIGPSP